MRVGYSLAGLACAESAKPCQKALACLDGARLGALGGWRPLRVAWGSSSLPEGKASFFSSPLALGWRRVSPVRYRAPR